jgi:long-chain acyl-CoA synthetase
MTMTPLNGLFHQATTQPDGIAFIYDDVVWTYHDLLTSAERLSRAFLAHGVRPGDRVVLHMPNRPEMAIALYACFRIGAIACPTNLRFKTAELREVFQRLQPALYLGEEQLYSYVETIESEILANEKRFVTGPSGAYRGAMPWWTLLISSAAGRLPLEPDKDAPAVLLTTSGTTGAPKFVTHTPATLSAIVDAFVDTDLDAAQIALNACPMVHATGLFTFLRSVNRGAPMVMVERFDPDAVLDRIELHGCTWMLGLPFMYDALLERQRKQPRKVSSLRHCRCGGDVCPIQLQVDFEATFGAPLRNGWGATEVVGALREGSQPGPVTRIAPGAQIRLVDDEGRDVPRGEVGEFLVRGPYVTVGYWVAPDRMDDATPDGWYHSGDLMRQGEGRRAVVRRPQEGYHHPRRVQHLSGRGRAGPSEPSSGARGRGLRHSGSRAGPASGGHRATVERRGRRRAWRHSEGHEAAAGGLQGAGAAVGCRCRATQPARQTRSPGGGGGNGDARQGRLIPMACGLPHPCETAKRQPAVRGFASANCG